MNVEFPNTDGTASNVLKGTSGSAHVRLNDSYDSSEQVTKIAMLVWDTNTLSWIKYTGGGGAGSSVTVLNFPADPSTGAKQTTGNASLASIDTKLTNPLPVSGAFYQATQPVSGTFFQTTQPVSGTFFQATQPVSAASLPLPSGASTSAAQTTGNNSLSSIDTKLTNPLPVSGTFYQATQPVSGPLTDTQLRASAVPVDIEASSVDADGRISITTNDVSVRRLMEANVLELMEQSYRNLTVFERCGGDRYGFEMR